MAKNKIIVKMVINQLKSKYKKNKKMKTKTIRF